MSNDNFMDNINDRGQRMMRSHYDKLDVEGQARKQVNVSDGKLKVFGWELPVGPFATIIRPFLSMGINNLVLSWSKHVNNVGTNLASLFLPAAHAAKVGKALSVMWMIGVPFMDVGLSVKKTVMDGFRQMKGLRDQAQPLLAANNNMDVGFHKALTCNFGAYRDARMRVWEESKHNALTNAVSFIRVLPSIAMAAYQSRLNTLLGNKSAPAPVATEHSTLQGHTPDAQWTAFFGMLNNPQRINNLTKKNKNEAELQQALNDLKMTPVLTDFVGEIVAHQRNKKPSHEIAWDKIMVLQEYMDRHREKADCGRVSVLVKDVLQRRAKDLDIRGDIEGADFNKAATAIAEAIISGLHPQALAEIMDNRQIMVFGPHDVDFSDIVDVKDQLDIIKEKYSRKISEKELYLHSDFTPQMLPQIWKGMPDDEKPIFVTLFPAGMLEKAGIAKDEVKKSREAGAQGVQDTFNDVVKTLLETDTATLKKDGLKEKLIRKIEDFRKAYEQMQRQDCGTDEFIHKNESRAKELLRNTLATAPKFWQERMKARGAEAAERLQDDDEEERPRPKHAKHKHGSHESGHASYER